MNIRASDKVRIVTATGPTIYPKALRLALDHVFVRVTGPRYDEMNQSHVLGSTVVDKDRWRDLVAAVCQTSPRFLVVSRTSDSPVFSWYTPNTESALPKTVVRHVFDTTGSRPFLPIVLVSRLALLLDLPDAVALYSTSKALYRHGTAHFSRTVYEQHTVHPGNIVVVRTRIPPRFVAP
jgi:hypothetical protein